MESGRCCYLGQNLEQCRERAIVEIHSMSGNTETCARHIYDLLEDCDNIVYVIDELEEIVAKSI